MKKISYQTRQKKAILDYLKSTRGRHVTIHDISKHLEDAKTPVGMTTVYRYMDALVNEGFVKKYLFDGLTGACFQYIDEALSDDSATFHFKCEVCGTLIHFQCRQLESLQEHMMQSHQFDINSGKTVFYGQCAHCRENV